MTDTQKGHRWPKVVGIAAAAVVVAVAIALLALDSWLTGKAQEQAARLSQELGRPVRIGRVSTRILTGLGARVTDVSIGPAAGEPLPLAEVPRAEVKVGLLRALFSGGKEIAVRSAEVEGLRLNVIRFPDGTTNVERLRKKLAAAEPGKPQPQGAEPRAQKPADLSAVRVEHAALKDARIALVDRGGQGSRELAIDHLDVEVNDLAAGKPLDVLVRAAVLAPKQNLEVRLHAAPLPPSLVPTPERVTLKIEPIDLAPLGPFLPADVGLEAGHLEASLDAALGGLVSGGSGQAKILGGLRATGLRFRGGSRPLDVVLDADVAADPERGDLRIGKLVLDLGPGGLRGEGRVTGLASGTPRAEGLRVVSHDLDPAVLAQSFPPLERALGGRVAGPIGLALQASGTPEAPAVELRVDLTPVRMSFPGTLAKAAGGKATLVAHVRGGGASGAVGFDAAADLSGLDLRPGGSLAKGPGDRLSLEVAGTRRSSGREQTIDLSRVELGVLADTLTGKGTVATGGTPGRPTTRFDAEFQSAHLDADRLLVPTPPKKESKPLDPKTFEGLSGRAGVRIGVLRARKADLHDVVAEIRMQGDEVVVERAQAGAFGGQVTANGTRMRLAHPEEPFHAVADVKGIEIGDAVAMFAPAKVVTGRFDGKVDLTGGGREKKELAMTLAGLLGGDIADGTFHGKDLVAGVAGPLAKALPFAAPGLKASNGTALGKSLPFALKFANGVATLEKPLRIARPEAAIDLGGGFRLDGTLDMAGTVALAPTTIAALTGGKVRPQGPIPVTFKMTGPAWSPSLGDLGLQPAVAAIAREAGTAALGKALGLPGGTGGAPGASKQQAEDQAKAKGQDAQKKLEDEARKRLQGIFGK